MEDRAPSGAPSPLYQLGRKPRRGNANAHATFPGRAQSASAGVQKRQAHAFWNYVSGSRLTLAPLARPGHDQTAV
jgi:hypothetical protein